jgi:hypothetical protein
MYECVCEPSVLLFCCDAMHLCVHVCALYMITVISAIDAKPCINIPFAVLMNKCEAIHICVNVCVCVHEQVYAPQLLLPG